MASRTNPRLVPLGSDSAGFDLAATTAIGSAPGNDFIVVNPTVSRRHATITRLDNRFELNDLGATNGTYVNGIRVTSPVDLKDGDELRFGAAKFRFANPVPARSSSRRRMTAIVGGSLIFAAGFAITIYVVYFDRLQGAIETSSHPSPLAANETLSNSTYSPGSSVPDSISTNRAGLEASSPPSSTDADANETSPNADDSWLVALNAYRKSAGLAAVTENKRLSRGDYLHSRYIVKNYGEQIAAHVNLGPEMHFEDPSKPWYTVDGKNAGLAGDVDQLWSPRGPTSPSWAIDNWMQAPFHRLPILNPHLHSVGYGAICEKPVCIASLNLNSDVDPMFSAPEKLPKPIMYPPDGASIDVNSFQGEWPDPFSICAGYTIPSGYPITLQLGSLVNTSIASYSLKQTAPTEATLEACTFDAGTYRNPDPGTQNMTRNQLASFGAVVMMPRAPLTPGTYSVSIDAGGHDYSWSFTVRP